MTAVTSAWPPRGSATGLYPGGSSSERRLARPPIDRPAGVPEVYLQTLALRSALRLAVPSAAPVAADSESRPTCTVCRRHRPGARSVRSGIERPAAAAVLVE